MVFSSPVFLFIFLPVTIGIYYILSIFRGGGYKNYWLLFVSLIFYAWNKPTFVLLLIASIVINYFFGRLIGLFQALVYKRAGLIVCLCANLGLLFYFKYFNLTVDTINLLFKSDIRVTEVLLPIGISFFTFQGISYVVDVYRQEVADQKNLFKLGMYISMFPQLVAGPIVRYKDIAVEIDKRHVSLLSFAGGVQRFIIGLFKKVIIADYMALIADNIFSLEANLNSVPVAWIGAIAYTIQIFFDFSGYSDMAIGLGAMFGFHFMENFNYPYISKSITEFWRRWHISLSSFFRDYVYIPLGGNRKHVYLNVAIVFLLTGIWHGAAYTFIVWGIWHGIFNIAEKVMGDRFQGGNAKGSLRFFARGIKSIVSHFYTMLVVIIGWVIFRAPTLKYAMQYIAAMFGLNNSKNTAFSVQWYLDKQTILITVIACAISTPLVKRIYNGLKDKISTLLFTPVEYVISLLILWLCMMQVASNSYSPFIYFQF